MLQYGMIIETLTKTEQSVINSFISLVINAIDIESIYLFGSRARSEGHTESDVDVAVIVGNDLSVKDVTKKAIDLSIQAEDESGVSGELLLSPIILSKSQLYSNIGLGKTVMEEGVLLWSKGSQARKRKAI